MREQMTDGIPGWLPGAPISRSDGADGRRIWRIGIVLLTAALFAPGLLQAQSAARRSEPEYLTSAAAVRSNLPFSEAVRVGNMLYVSGTLGVVPGTMELVKGGIEAEARQALENVRSILERNGSSMDRVVKCTVMLADMSEWPALNRVYVTFFKEHYPARSAMGVNGLALGGRVEIECMAVTSPSE